MIGHYSQMNWRVSLLFLQFTMAPWTKRTRTIAHMLLLMAWWIEPKPSWKLTSAPAVMSTVANLNDLTYAQMIVDKYECLKDKGIGVSCVYVSILLYNSNYLVFLQHSIFLHRKRWKIKLSRNWRTKKHTLRQRNRENWREISRNRKHLPSWLLQARRNWQ